MITIYEFEELAIKECDKWYKMACGYYNIPYVPLIVTFTCDGLEAGRAYISRDKTIRRVDFNIPLALTSQENLEKFIDDTFPHEVCHIITKIVYPKAKAHGREFKGIMRLLGKGGHSATHTMDISKVRKKTQRYFYSCGCRTVLFTAKRHGLVIRGRYQYKCNLCKELMVFVRELVDPPVNGEGHN